MRYVPVGHDPGCQIRAIVERSPDILLSMFCSLCRPEPYPKLALSPGTNRHVNRLHFSKVHSGEILKIYLKIYVRIQFVLIYSLDTFGIPMTLLLVAARGRTCHSDMSL